MTSRKTKTLAERQLAMKLRHGRPVRLTGQEQDRLRRRIAGTALLHKGFTVEQLAEVLSVNPESVRAWIKAGTPLL